MDKEQNAPKFKVFCQEIWPRLPLTIPHCQEPKKIYQYYSKRD